LGDSAVRGHHVAQRQDWWSAQRTAKPAVRIADRRVMHVEGGEQLKRPLGQLLHLDTEYRHGPRLGSVGGQRWQLVSARLAQRSPQIEQRRATSQRRAQVDGTRLAKAGEQEPG
jgi:hypothetical protein